MYKLNCTINDFLSNIELSTNDPGISTPPFPPPFLFDWRVHQTSNILFSAISGQYHSNKFFVWPRKLPPATICSDNLNSCLINIVFKPVITVVTPRIAYNFDPLFGQKKIFWPLGHHPLHRWLKTYTVKMRIVN